jgi:hypothetical protein
MNIAGSLGEPGQWWNVPLVPDQRLMSSLSGQPSTAAFYRLLPFRRNRSLRRSCSCRRG